MKPPKVNHDEPARRSVDDDYKGRAWTGRAVRPGQAPSSRRKHVDNAASVSSRASH